jgi:two-component system, cell cycle response regulator DivK
MGRLGPVVLFVDDDQDTRELYEWALSAENLRIITLADGEQALQSIAEVKPDVIVTDLSMPDRVDGYELIRQLRGRPVIALTAWADPAHVARAVAAGCTMVLVKPCAPDTLVEAIRALLASA